MVGETPDEVRVGGATGPNIPPPGNKSRDPPEWDQHPKPASNMEQYPVNFTMKSGVTKKIWYCSAATGGKCGGKWRVHHPNVCKGQMPFAQKPGKPGKPTLAINTVMSAVTESSKMEVSFDKTELVVEAKQAIVVPVPRGNTPPPALFRYTREMDERHKMLKSIWIKL